MSKVIVYDSHSIQCRWKDHPLAFDPHVFFAGCEFFFIKVCSCQTMYSKVDFFHRIIESIYGEAERSDGPITWKKIVRRRHDNAFKEYRLRQTPLPEKSVAVCYIYGHNAIGEWAITAESDYLMPLKYADEINKSYEETKKLIIEEYPEDPEQREKLLDDLRWLWFSNQARIDNKELVRSMNHLIKLINKQTRNESKHEVTTCPCG